MTRSLRYIYAITSCFALMSTFGMPAVLHAQNLGTTVSSTHAAQTIRARQIIADSDIMMKSGSAGAHDANVIIGMEAVKTIYAGRPILISDVTEPAMVERNALVTLIFSKGGLHIETEARALERAQHGQFIRAMNLDSRMIVTARVIGPARLQAGE